MRASERSHVYSNGFCTHARLRICIVLIETEKVSNAFTQCCGTIGVQNNAVTCILRKALCDC